MPVTSICECPPGILDLKIHQSMWIHWSFFPKTWTKGHWSLHDLWPHVCWGHMCDSTQGSLCPSPMTIHQCMWIQWSILQITTYIHILATYIHTTYIYYIHTTHILRTEWVITQSLTELSSGETTDLSLRKNMVEHFGEVCKGAALLCLWENFVFDRPFHSFIPFLVKNRKLTQDYWDKDMV